MCTYTVIENTENMCTCYLKILIQQQKLPTTPLPIQILLLRNLSAERFQDGALKW